MVKSPCIYIAKGAFTWRKQFRRQASSISQEADVESYHVLPRAMARFVL